MGVRSLQHVGFRVGTHVPKLGSKPRGMFLVIVLKIYDSAIYVRFFNFKERLNQKSWRFG